MTSYIRVKMPKGEFIWFSAHGARSNIQRNPNPLRRDLARKVSLMTLLQDYDADVKGVGHWHFECVIPPIDEKAIQLHGDRIKLRPRSWSKGWIYCVPAMFTSFTENEVFPSYAERLMLKPTALGWLELIVDERGKIHGMDYFNEDGVLIKEYREQTIIA
jgi:hypothetical protein